MIPHELVRVQLRRIARKEVKLEITAEAVYVL